MSSWSTYTAKVLHKFENHGNYKSLFKAMKYVFVYTVFMTNKESTQQVKYCFINTIT